MRLPTDAQARLLALIEDEGPVFMSKDGNQIWKRGNPAILGGDGVVGLEGRAIYPRGHYRSPATAQRCVDEGWIVNDPMPWLDDDGNLVVDLSDDGRIALGLWRQRQMAKPPAPDPVLEGANREVVALAEHANRLGYRLVPDTDAAKKQARRLSRDGWVERGWTGQGTKTVDPTPMAVVEVNPSVADVPDPPTQKLYSPEGI